MRFIYVLRYFLKEAIHNLWANRLNNLISIAIISFSLFTVGLFLLIAQNLSGLMGQWTENIRVNAFLKDKASEDMTARVEAVLKASPVVAGYKYISRSEALERFRRFNPAMSELADDLKENPFPPSYEISIRREFQNTTVVQQLVSNLRADSSVTDVEYDQDWIDRLHFIIRSVRIIGLGFGGILVMTAMFSISNVIKLIVLSRRDEVEIMRLVGATNSFIKGPFLTEGLLHGLLGALIALGLLYGIYDLITARIAGLGVAYLLRPLNFLSGWFTAIVLASGMTLGFFGSLFSLRKLLKI